MFLFTMFTFEPMACIYQVHKNSVQNMGVAGNGLTVMKERWDAGVFVVRMLFSREMNQIAILQSSEIYGVFPGMLSPGNRCLPL